MQVVKTTAEIFRENLKRLRKAKFPKQEVFAPLAGFVSVRGYQKYEQGESAPTPEMLDRLAKALGCSPWDLIIPDGVYVSDGETRTIGQMTIEEFDGHFKAMEPEIERLKKENAVLKKFLDSIPGDLAAVWEKGLPARGVCRYLVLGDESGLPKLPLELRKMLRVIRNKLPS